MRTIAILSLLGILAYQQSTPPMLGAKVEHHERTETQTHDEVTVSCPDGYEGHFVDENTGFGYEYWMGSSGYGFSYNISGTPGYTICFDKKFMDDIRKKPELLRMRPPQPHGV